MARRALALGLAPAALAVAVACGGDVTGQTTVRFWAFGREGDVVRELLPEFTRRYPDLRVEVQQVPWTAAHEKLLTAHVGGATPDVAQLGNTWIPEFVTLGALAPLDDRLARSSTIASDDYFDGSWRSNVMQGPAGATTWGVPWYVDTRVLFYRSDLVAASGAAWPPRTWEDLRRAMQRVQALGREDAFAILMPVDEWDKPVLLGLQAGSSLLDDGRYGAFAEPPFRRALAFYLDLFRSGLAPPLTHTGVANLYQQFAEGHFAMLVTGPWNLGELRRRLPEALQDKWATAPLPALDASTAYPGVSIAGGSSLVVFETSAHKDASWQLVEFLAEAEQQARFYELSGNLPARRSAWALTDLERDPRATAFRDQLLATAPLPQVPEWEQIASRIAARVEEAVRGLHSLDEAVTLLDADVDRILAKRRSLMDAATGREGS